MVQIRTSTTVSGVAGSSSGNTFSRNRTGIFARSRTVPVNTRSAAQSKSRAAFALLTKMFSEDLSPQQQAAWNNYAHAITVQNKLGETIKLTGQLHFVRSNEPRLTAGMTAVSNAPAVLSLPEQDHTLSVEVLSSLSCLWVFFDENKNWVQEDGAFLSLYLGREKSRTTNYYNGPWRFADKILGSSTSPPVSPMAYQFTAPVTAGNKMFYKIMLGQADGRVTNPMVKSVIIRSV